MQQVAIYRANAEEAEQLARRVSFRPDRDRLREMAEQYRRRAEELEREALQRRATAPPRL